MRAPRRAAKELMAVAALRASPPRCPVDEDPSTVNPRASHRWLLRLEAAHPALACSGPGPRSFPLGRSGGGCGDGPRGGACCVGGQRGVNGSSLRRRRCRSQSLGRCRHRRHHLQQCCYRKLLGSAWELISGFFPFRGSVERALPLRLRQAEAEPHRGLGCCGLILASSGASEASSDASSA